MPVGPFHREVARLALTVAQDHGFALGGGLALISHGMLDRPTADVDLFGDTEFSVSTAADEVRAALEAAGIRVVVEVNDSSLGEVIDGLDDHMIELTAQAESRDFVDVPVFLASRTPDELLTLAREVDPGMEDEDVAAVGRRLDHMPDRELACYGLDGTAIAAVRRRFAVWPRPGDNRAMR